MTQSALATPDGLLEREHEIERIRGAVRAVGQRAGGVVVIEGAAGMGKSRLLEHARERASKQGLRVLSARAAELEQGFPFGVIRQLFERTIAEAEPSQRERWLAGAAALAADVLTAAPTSSSGASERAAGVGDPSYAWRHGLYWLASNLSADSPLVLMVDDLQWCDVPSARALAFIARRLEGQPVGLIMATRPLDPGLIPDAAMVIADPVVELLRLSPLTEAAVGALAAARLGEEPTDRFIRACLEVTGGNPFFVGELLAEATARGVDPNAAAAAAEVGAIVPRGVANAVLLRLARLAPTAASLARALSVLGDGAQVGDAARLAGLTEAELEASSAALVSAGIMESGGSVAFRHPILRTAIYDDLSRAERERLHRAAAALLRERGAPPDQVAAHVMHTEPAADSGAVELLRDAARDSLALGDAAGAASLLSRALDEPPASGDRAGVMLELGRAYARAGAPEAMVPLTEIVTFAEDPPAIATAAIELSGMLIFAGRAAEGAVILRQAQERLPLGDPNREQLQVALMAVSLTSISARRGAGIRMPELRAPERSARGGLPAATLAALAMDEVLQLGSADTAADLAERAFTAGLPPEPHRAWAGLALAVLAISDRLDSARRHADDILAEARHRGAALTVATALAHRAFVHVRSGDLSAAEADAQAAIDLAKDLVASDFVVVVAVPMAVLVGLDRGATVESLQRLIDETGVRQGTSFIAHSLARYGSGVLRAAAGRHEAAIEELDGCARDDPIYGGENPAFVPWRSSAALSLAELGRHDEARELAADELKRSESFGAPRAIGIALRSRALVGPPAERYELLTAAVDVLKASPAPLEHARALVDLGATLRAAGQRIRAREPLLEALDLAARSGAHVLERRTRAELAAVGVRPRTTHRAGKDSLTSSERRVVELAAAGGTNREIAQALFVTEKTVETHLGRAFRKLDVTSRRQLPDVLAPSAG
jgi:DNA-binding CsgD family transcriptional regulator